MLSSNRLSALILERSSVVASRPGIGSSIARAGAAAASWLILAITAPLVSLTGQHVHRFFLAVILLDIPLQIDNNLAYLPGADEFGALAGFNVSITTLALCVLYLRWTILLVTGHAGRSSAPWRVVLPLTAYVAFAGLSTFAAKDFALSLRELFLLCQMFLLYVYVVRMVRSRDEMLFLLTWLVIGLALEGSLMLVGAYKGASFSIPGLNLRAERGGWIFVDTAMGGRVGGTIGSPNGAAAYLSVMLAPAVCLILLSRGARRLLGLAGAGLGTMAVITTESRGGWTATLVSLVLFYGVLTWHRRVSLKGPLIAAGLMLILTLGLWTTVQERLTEDDNGSAQSRLPLMRTAIQMISDHPLIGVGANNYSTAMRQYGPLYGYWGDWVFTVHNKFALVWAETGLGGLVAFIWFLGATIRQGCQAWKAADRAMSMLALAFTAALVGHVIHLNVDLFSERPQVQLLWVVCGLISVMRHLQTTAAKPLTARERIA